MYASLEVTSLEIILAYLRQFQIRTTEMFLN